MSGQPLDPSVEPFFPSSDFPRNLAPFYPGIDHVPLHGSTLTDTDSYPQRHGEVVENEGEYSDLVQDQQSCVDNTNENAFPDDTPLRRGGSRGGKRGPLKQDQRDRRAIVRDLGACNHCRRKKIKCKHTWQAYLRQEEDRKRKNEVHQVDFSRDYNNAPNESFEQEDQYSLPSSGNAANYYQAVPAPNLKFTATLGSQPFHSNRTTFTLPIRGNPSLLQHRTETNNTMYAAPITTRSDTNYLQPLPRVDLSRILRPHSHRRQRQSRQYQQRPSASMRSASSVKSGASSNRTASVRSAQYQTQRTSEPHMYPITSPQSPLAFSNLKRSALEEISSPDIDFFGLSTPNVSVTTPWPGEYPIGSASHSPSTACFYPPYSPTEIHNDFVDEFPNLDVDIHSEVSVIGFTPSIDIIQTQARPPSNTINAHGNSFERYQPNPSWPPRIVPAQKQHERRGFGSDRVDTHRQRRPDHYRSHSHMRLSGEHPVRENMTQPRYGTHFVNEPRDFISQIPQQFSSRGYANTSRHARHAHISSPLLVSSAPTLQFPLYAMAGTSPAEPYQMNTFNTAAAAHTPRLARLDATNHTVNVLANSSVPIFQYQISTSEEDMTSLPLAVGTFTTQDTEPASLPWSLLSNEHSAETPYSLVDSVDVRFQLSQPPVLEDVTSFIEMLEGDDQNVFAMEEVKGP